MLDKKSFMVLGLVAFAYLFAQAQQPSVNAPFAHKAGAIRFEKLLTQQVGWAATRSHLFWTSAGGEHWKEITPKVSSDNRIIAAVFFLDPSKGWVLLAGSDNNEHTRLDLAATEDAGSTWKIYPVKTSGLTPPEASLSGDASMYFLDADRGWINLGVASGSAFHPGAMLATQDGGKAWNWVPRGSGSAGEIYFHNKNDGWILSPDQTELDATHDGSKSWQEISLLAPEFSTAKGEHPYSYFLPIFEDETRGFLLASFPKADPVLFSTSDGGRTWKPGKTVPVGDSSAVEIVGSGSIVLGASIPLRTHSLTVTAIPLNSPSGAVSTKADISSLAAQHETHDIDALDFVDREHGWALGGELLATSDGGVSWNDITPVEASSKHHLTPDSANRQHNQASAEFRVPIETTNQSARPPAFTPNVQTSLAFDTGLVLCTNTGCSTQKSIGYMQTWLNASPYLATSLYLPSPNHTTDPNLNSTWVSGVQNQGWGLIPVWVGLQSPCACKPNTGTFPACTLAFSKLIGPDAATAKTQGSSEAKNAESVAAGLSTGIGIIYKDIENYNPASVLSNGATCGSVVDAYLDSWDTQLHADNYSAGVYGNPIPAVDWSKNVSPLPDDAWIAQYPAAGSPPSVTIWNIGTKYGMTDSMWPTYQRIHQYTNTHTESWGSTPQFKVDNDIVNAEIQRNNNATNYTYGYSNIDCAGAINTYPVAINDMNNGAMIVGPGETGTIVGSFEDSSSVTHGFVNTGSGCSQIDYLGAVVTNATGINNLGQIVGYWEDSSAAIHGFLQNPGKAATAINYPGATETYVYGINDAAQIVGYAYIPGLGFEDFIYYGGKYYPFGYSGTSGYTLAFGINGDATTAGFYSTSMVFNFEAPLSPPNWTGQVNTVVPSGNYNTYARGIDANNDLVGGYVSASCPNYCGFVWDNNVLFTVLSYGGATGAYAFGINDFGQVVGNYTDSMGFAHGALWTPQ